MECLVTANRRIKAVAAQATHASDAMSIREVKAYARLGAGADSAYSLLQVTTRSGMVGYGECPALTGQVVETLQGIVGRPAYAYEMLLGIAPAAARGGLNMALLDILGKATKAPIYRVLGGPTRGMARVLVRLHGETDRELVKEAKAHRDAGVRAFLAPIHAPASRNQGGAFLTECVERQKALRSALPDCNFGLGALHQLTPSDAALLAAATEPERPLWLDEPCSVSNLSTLSKISDESVVPLAFGKDVFDPATFQDLLREGAVDVIRPDLLVHGISGACRIAFMAETYYCAVAPSHSGGPLATAAGLHVAGSIPNFFALEIPASQVGTVKIRDGFLSLPTEPGLGVSLDMKAWERNRIA